MTLRASPIYPEATKRVTMPPIQRNLIAFDWGGKRTRTDHRIYTVARWKCEHVNRNSHPQFNHIA